MFCQYCNAVEGETCVKVLFLQTYTRTYISSTC